MFRKTRIQLVVLNSVIFFLIINCFGFILYFEMKKSIYSKIDMSLRELQDHYRTHIKSRTINILKDEMKDTGVNRRILFLSWDKDGNYINSTPGYRYSQKEINYFKKFSSYKNIQTVILNQKSYRVANLDFGRDSNEVIYGTPIATLQIIYNFDPEKSILDSLFYDVLVGGLLSLLVSLMAGLFLANRALVPIQLSWKKQQEFVADASHELRTPLSVIRVHLERLFDFPYHTIEQECENILTMVQETKRVNKLIEGLLTLARSDSDQLEIMAQKVRLDEIIHKVVTLFKELAALKGVHLKTYIDAPLELMGDWEKLHQLLVIIVDNALKYTEEGVISIDCHETRNSVNIQVKDTGIGISEEDLPFIFDRFFRCEKSRTSLGTGLGLSIAKSIVEAHGGKIHAESKMDEGTIMFLSFPK